MATTTKKDVNQQGLIKEQANKAAKQKRTPTLKDYVQQMAGQFEKALPSVITPERFTRIALTALSANPQLMQCDRNSFLGSLMQAAQLGLEPNTPLGQAYLIPFKNKKKGITECQFQIGYKGLIDLAYRSGDMASIQAYCVYANDNFDYELGLEPVLKHKPAKNNRGELEYVYAVFKLQNGGYGFEVMSIEDIKQHAQKYSQGFKSSYSPWKTNFDEMAKKTVLKKVLKYAPIKTDFQRAVAVDEHTITAKEDSLHDDIELEVEYTINDAEDVTADEAKDSDI
jgi:recombination protein RecT